MMRSVDGVTPGRLLGVFLLAVSVGCGSVKVPETFYYRLALPNPEPVAALQVPGPRLGIAELRLGADLAGDRMMVAGGPVAVQFFHYHRWAAPLDRMLEDALLVGLARRGRFGDVRRATLPGDCDYELAAQVLRFGVAAEADGWVADVLVAVRLARPDGGLLFRQEFASRLPIAAREPAAAVRALSRAVGEIGAAFEAHCRAHGVFDPDPGDAAAPTAAPGPGEVPAARPPR